MGHCWGVLVRHDQPQTISIGCRDLNQQLAVVSLSDPYMTTPEAAEPCSGCGEETAAGSVFFSDRHAIEQADGRRAYLCALCDSRIRSSRKGRPLTAQEVRSIVENGSAIALTWRP